MFEVHLHTGANDYVIDNNDPYDVEHKLISPQLELEENTFGSLKFTVPKAHANYDDFMNDDSEIEVLRYATPDDEDPELIFVGRLLESARDAKLNRAFIFEGEMSYLQDTIQEPREYDGVTPAAYMSAVLAIHNAKVPEQKRFYVGTITVTDDSTTDYITGFINRGSYTTNYSTTTWSALSTMLSELGGYFRVRRDQLGRRYLDYLAEHTEQTNQKIELGRNLLDYAEEWSLSDLYTVIVPIGADYQSTDENGESITLQTTIASVNNGSNYLRASQAILAKYGRREKMVEFKGILDPSHLLSIAQLYLTNTQFDNMVLRLTAVDLAELGVDVDRLKFQSVVHAKADIFDLDGEDGKAFPITKISLPLKQPGKAVYGMSTNTRKIRSMSTKITDYDKNAQQMYNDLDKTFKEYYNAQRTQARSDGADVLSDWIFGYPELVYCADERNKKYLSINDNMLRAWDGMAFDDMTVKRLTTVAGQPNVTVPSYNRDIISSDRDLTEEQKINKAMDIGDNENYAFLPDKATYGGAFVQRYAKDGNQNNYMRFFPYSMGHIKMPMDEYADNRLYYIVARWPELTAGQNYATIGYSDGTTNYRYFYVDSDGYLCWSGNSVGNERVSWRTDDSPLAMPLVVSGKDVVIMIARPYAVIEGEDHNWRPTCLLGYGNYVYHTESNISLPAAATAALNINYPTPEAEPTGQQTYPHELDVARVVECGGLSGQVTADEVYTNMEWLVARFVTKQLASDMDELPEVSS